MKNEYHQWFILVKYFKFSSSSYQKQFHVNIFLPLKLRNPDFYTARTNSLLKWRLKSIIINVSFLNIQKSSCFYISNFMNILSILMIKCTKTFLVQRYGGNIYILKYCYLIIVFRTKLNILHFLCSVNILKNNITNSERAKVFNFHNLKSNKYIGQNIFEYYMVIILSVLVSCIINQVFVIWQNTIPLSHSSFCLSQSPYTKFA